VPNARIADFSAVTDEVIRWHLSGSNAAGNPFVAGVYPLFAGRDLLVSGHRFRQDQFGGKTPRPASILAGV